MLRGYVTFSRGDTYTYYMFYLQGLTQMMGTGSNNTLGRDSAKIPL